MRRDVLAAVLGGLFFWEAVAWLTRTDFTHWVRMRERPSRAWIS